MQRAFFDFPNLGKLVLRLSVGFLILLHGIYKLRFGIDFIGQWLHSLSLPSFLSYGVYIGEVVAPIFIIVGLFVRISSFIVLINMCAAIFFLISKGYAPFSLNSVGGLQAEIDVILLCGALSIMCLGSGKFGFQNS